MFRHFPSGAGQPRGLTLRFGNLKHLERHAACLHGRGPIQVGLGRGRAATRAAPTGLGPECTWNGMPDSHGVGAIRESPLRWAAVGMRIPPSVQFSCLRCKSVPLGRGPDEDAELSGDRQNFGPEEQVGVETVHGDTVQADPGGGGRGFRRGWAFGRRGLGGLPSRGRVSGWGRGLLWTTSLIAGGGIDQQAMPEAGAIVRIAGLEEGGIVLILGNVVVRRVRGRREIGFCLPGI